MADLSPTGTLADYVSGTSGTGEVRVKVSCSTSAGRFDLSADRLRLHVGSALAGHTLTVIAVGTGTGTVISSPPGISCGADCSQDYIAGTMVTLTATPAGGSTFSGWSGDCSGTVTCQVTMNAPKSITATFASSTATVMFPSSFTVESGATLSGNVSSLGADDNNYLVVRSTKSGTKVATWFGTFTGVDNSISSLHASYRGKSSFTCTQVISIFRWTDSSWVQLDSRSIGDAEVEVADLSPTGTLAAYVSGTSGTGEVRVKVSCSTSEVRFDLSADLLKLVI